MLQLKSVQLILVGLVLLILGGILGWKVLRYRQRSTRDGAVKQVHRVLQRYARFRGAGTTVLQGEEVLGGNRMELLLAGPFGLLMVRVIPEGTIVYGEARSSHWRMRSDGDMIEFPNPLLDLEQRMEEMRMQWAKRGLYGVPMAPLVVFTYPGKVELFLQGVEHAVTMKQLGRTLREHPQLVRDGGVEVPRLMELLRKEPRPNGR